MRPSRATSPHPLLCPMWDDCQPLSLQKPVSCSPGFLLFFQLYLLHFYYCLVYFMDQRLLSARLEGLSTTQSWSCLSNPTPALIAQHFNSSKRCVNWMGSICGGTQKKGLGKMCPASCWQWVPGSPPGGGAGKPQRCLFPCHKQSQHHWPLCNHVFSEGSPPYHKSSMPRFRFLSDKGSWTCWIWHKVFLCTQQTTKQRRNASSSLTLACPPFTMFIISFANPQRYHRHSQKRLEGQV